MNNKNIQYNLREYQKRLNLKKVDALQSLGFKSKDRTSRWEKRTAYPNVLNALKLAKIYGVTLEDIFYIKTLH